MKRAILWTIAIVSLPLFSSCDRNVYSLNVIPETLRITRADDHPVLSASVVDYEGEAIPINEVTWHSSDTHVVEVSDTGRVSARGNGEAVIIAKTKNDEFEVKVVVALIGE